MQKEIEFNDQMEQMLIKLGSVFKKFGVDFYLVGAVARDVHLRLNSDYTATRKTRDVDLAVMLADEDQFYNVKEALL